MQTPIIMTAVGCNQVNRTRCISTPPTMVRRNIGIPLRRGARHNHPPLVAQPRQGVGRHKAAANGMDPAALAINTSITAPTSQLQGIPSIVHPLLIGPAAIFTKLLRQPPINICICRISPNSRSIPIRLKRHSNPDFGSI